MSKSFVLSGIGTRNKGAELMLYAILQELERRFPQAKVYLPNNEYTVDKPISYLETSLDIRRKKNYHIKKILQSFYIINFFNSFHRFFLHRGHSRIADFFMIKSQWFDDRYVVKNVDYFIDASGYHFSDQFNLSERIIQEWQSLEEYSKRGCKIIFLPQAFGSIRKESTIRAFNPVLKFADLIFAREKQSYSYLQECGCNMKKVHIATDFTALVDGVFPQQYRNLKGCVCIIPNIQMVNNKIFTLNEYVKVLLFFIEVVRECGRNVYLLNHEGCDDAKIIGICRETLGSSIEIVDGLNALETKGLIASSYLCISSRYHGVASALSSGVPCLATSWSHKYSFLFADYGIQDGILPITNLEMCRQIISQNLQENNHANMVMHLSKMVPRIKDLNKAMWNKIWSV